MRALRFVGGAVAALILAATACYVLGLGHVVRLLAEDARAQERSPLR